MKRLILCMFVSSVLTILSVQALAEWTAQKDPLGPGWLVTNGDKTIRAKDEKSAEKKAKLLNKGAAEFKADPGDGPCNDPRSGVLC